MTEKKYKTFAEFWPFYLEQHSNPVNRRLHFVGTLMVFVVLALAIVTTTPWILLLMPVVGYGWAWVGHFRVEKNRPATFQYPFFSLRGDFKLFFEMLAGRHWG
jgi:hypothetical protein